MRLSASCYPWSNYVVNSALHPGQLCPWALWEGGACRRGVCPGRDDRCHRSDQGSRIQGWEDQIFLPTFPSTDEPRSNADISVLSNQELLTESEKGIQSVQFSRNWKVTLQLFQVLPAGGTPRSFQGRLTRVWGRLDYYDDWWLLLWTSLVMNINWAF